ncbi:glutaminase family protein [Aestuariibaculum marinum]|uniref:DUF4965 domain-containing protein n=1 Tax=Aestuariibaculum marinum TaxID=2683592 RepID=A0A8J6PYP0_9FLAO|nr:glutaminase family protein [Aestuariibaculum marinum]MBD0825173.1 DUF4965 domain-containing protein [Aestuariibaculum marinum]
MLKKLLPTLLVFAAFFMNAQKRQAPAYPLITHDPNFSIWSMTDALNDEPTKHWTGKDHSLLGMIKVDDSYYRFLGAETKNYETVLAASDEMAYQADYVETKPNFGWEKTNYNSSSWKKGPAPFSNDKRNAKTIWTSDNLWYRRSFDLNKTNLKNLYLKLRHDDNVVVYLNGDKIYETEGWQHHYKYIQISQDIVNKLKQKNNVLAIHIKNTAGGQWLDAGLVTEAPSVESIEIIKAKQKSVEFNATQTIYDFECGGVDVKLTFTSPLLMDDLDLMSRPVSYIDTEIRSNDGKAHETQLYFGASSDIAVNTQDQKVISEKYNSGKLSILKSGTVEQPILKKKGDDLRIDWGYLYVAVPNKKSVEQFVSNEILLNPFSTDRKVELNNKKLLLNTVINTGKVSNSSVKETIMLGYDDIYSINYFGTNLRPWWNKDNSSSIEKELAAAYKNYTKIIKKCIAFDEELYQDALKAGGKEYANILEIGYRQGIAAHKLVESPQGEILFLSKENNSNGSINTVDVTYPSAPQYLVYNPDLLKGMLNGIFYYTESGKWKKPFPAHDLGTYPIATGQTYGGDMPVEEAGNMLILTAAIAMAEGNADYAEMHWETLTSWVKYLEKSGLDPENQLCTDDFAGHLARNANLSVKAIVAIAGYGYLAEQLGKKDVAEKYSKLSKSMAREWMQLADAGDHYALTFNDKNTWSQKYNLVWDKIMGLHTFPEEVIDKELNYYQTKQNAYGLPLDNRSDYTKSDWILWTATLADDNSLFKKIANPVYKFAIETPSRVPMSDWHFTSTGRMTGFKARSVVGGYFIKLLAKEWENGKR